MINNELIIGIKDMVEVSERKGNTVVVSNSSNEMDKLINSNSNSDGVNKQEKQKQPKINKRFEIAQRILRDKRSSTRTQTFRRSKNATAA